MKLIPHYKSWLIYHLESWAETFNNIYPDSMGGIDDEEAEAYDYIHLLIKRIRKNTCSKEDYEDILFHLWQAKYDL